MPFSFNWIDLAFIVTILLLVLNGFRNGLVASLLSLISLPLALAIVWLFGPAFTALLAANGLNFAPLLAYALLFIAVVIIVHIAVTVLRALIHRIPMVGLADELLGAVVGFVEAWLLWLIVLVVLHNALSVLANLPGSTPAQFSTWQQIYNDAISHSLFAQVNSFLISKVPVNRLP
jgi:uncharacterized membrane protein required for colicin V production